MNARLLSVVSPIRLSHPAGRRERERPNLFNGAESLLDLKSGLKEFSYLDLLLYKGEMRTSLKCRVSVLLYMAAIGVCLLYLQNEIRKLPLR